MPYIKPEDRYGVVPTTPGELNYHITKLCHEYLAPGFNYAALNEVIGVLECAKLELYRMLAAPYEDRKRAENGPISEHDNL